MERYIPQEIEKKWQKKWSDDGLYATDLTRDKKYYVLTEFAYPSGDLHMGHWFAWSGSDIFARYKRLEGHNVFFPNGFDAFGLPAENAAIKNNIHPSNWTMSNIERMKQQYTSMGASFTFDHEVITCLPNYYKWNQWLFLKLFEKGLAYQGTSMANWCESCQTVLANEGVEAGNCWRCGTVVIQKEVKQWFFKITDYAEKLIWDEKNQAEWPNSVKTAQNEWIGKSVGAEIEFRIVNYESRIKVFTTRPDTLFGATYLVLSPEHLEIKNLEDGITNYEEVEVYIHQAKKKSELERKSEIKEKTGVELKGIKAVNPANNQEIPVFVADYVLPGYGTGAIMAVPAHDTRDFEFANQFDLPIIQVITKDSNKARSYIMGAPRIKESDLIDLGATIKAKTEDGDLKVEIPKSRLSEYEKLINDKLDPGFWNEYVSDEIVFIFKFKDGLIKRIVLNTDTEKEIDKLASEFQDDSWDKSNVWKWLAENEFYTEMIVHSESGRLINSGELDDVKSEDAIDKIIQKVNGNKTVNYHLRDWSVSRQRYWGTPIPMIHCEKCGEVTVQEDQLPVELPLDVDYQPKGKSPLESNEDWLNVDCPKCGSSAKRDADTMDTFVDSSWYFFRYLSPELKTEIFDKALAQKIMPVDIYFGGSEHNLGHTLYSRFISKFIKDLGLVNFNEYALRRINHGIVLGPDGNKMSKSKGNVVNPDDEVKKYGADAVRVHLAFFMPYDGTGPWISERLSGSFRFLERVWNLFDKVSQIELQLKDEIWMNKVIKKVGEDIESIKYNTAVAFLMEWLNYLTGKEKISDQEYKTFLLLLSPFSPHITEELWHKLGSISSIHNENWPKYDESKLHENDIEIPVQINGKVRYVITTTRDAGEEVIKQMVQNHPDYSRWITGQPKKIIVIPLKIVTIIG